MKKIIASLILAVTPFVYAADDNWVVVTSSNINVYSIKKKSVVLEKTKGGTTVVVGLGRSKNIKSTTVSVFQMYVSVADCAKEGGLFVVTDLSGKITGESEFVYSLGTVASDMAELLCDVYKDTVPPPKPKSNKIIPTT